MKVDIVTRHAVANYGSILQAYATEKAFEKLGCEAEIINYVRKDEQGKNIVKTMLKRNKRWNKNKVTRAIYRLLQTEVYNKSYLKFEEFRNNFLKETKTLYDNEIELKKNLPDGDIFCTGSDQVWGKIGNVDFDPVYFLSFVPKDKKCISYAASFGKENINENLQKELSNYMRKYDAITVREDSAKNILKNIGFESEQVLDPTLLLSRKEWENVVTNSIEERGYVLIYQLHKNKDLEKYAEQFAKNVKKKLIRISISKLYFFKSGKLIYMPTPAEFLNYFKNAEYVISDSFHATVFSIIFNKKFIDVLPEGTGTRIVSILKLLGLEDRIVRDYNDFSLTYKDIDYELVNKKLEKQRKKSLNVLEKIIINKMNRGKLDGEKTDTYNNE